RVLRVERNSQQPLFTAGRDCIESGRAEIDERRGEHRAALDDPDLSGLLDHEDPLAAVVRVGDLDRRRKTGVDLVPDNGGGRRRRAQCREECESKREGRTAGDGTTHWELLATLPPGAATG